VRLIFEMHDLEKYHHDPKYPLVSKMIDAINKKGLPVICQKKYDFLPTSKAFPFDKMPRL